jgi:glycine betaine/choline ABC-type transport system substrate-binding protein
VIARIRGTLSKRVDRGQRVLSLIAALGLMFGTVVGTVAQDDKPAVSVGSKEFTEQFIVGEMLALLPATRSSDNSGWLAVLSSMRHS